MRKITIKTIGSGAESWQNEACLMYLQRLAPFAKITLTELPEGHGKSAKPDERKTREAEAASLLKNVSSDTIVLALDQSGKNLSSTELATKIQTLTESGQEICFMIGGSWGLDQRVLDRANFILSFGKQTLPHLLARIVLLEQLYRTETILSGKTYHK